MATQQGNLQRIIPALFTGRGGQLMMPDQIAREREIAAALMAPNQQPVTNWADGAAGLVDAFSGKRREGIANQAAERNASNSQRIQQALFGSMGGGSAPSFAPAFSPQAAIGGGMQPTAGIAGPPASVPTGDRASYIRQGLLRRGLPQHVADGFIHNFQDESGLNPGINEIAPLVPGSRGGFGLFQSTGPRRRALESVAQMRGLPASDIDTQLDVLAAELGLPGTGLDNQPWFGSEARAAKSIFGSRDTASAAQAIVNDFLRPSPEHRRSRAARYSRLGNSEPVQVASLDPSVGMAAAFRGEPQVGGSNGSVEQALFGSPADFAQQPTQLSQTMVPQQPQPQYQAPQPAAINPAILEALSSPYVDDQTRQIGMLLFQQEQQAQAAQAKAAADWNALQEQRQYDFGLTQEQRGYDRFLTGDQRAYDRTLRNEDFAREDARNLFTDTRQAGRDQRADFESDRNFGLAEQGLTPTSVREYEYARSQGYPGTFAEFEQEQRRAGAISVNLPGQPNIGTIPQGYAARQDEAGNWSMAPIPGGPEDTSAAAVASAGNRDVSTDIITNAAAFARNATKGGFLPVTGTLGRVAAMFPETGAAEVRRQVATLQANAKIENLQAMREASPTGGALGAVSDSENAMLAAKSGTLDPDSPNFLRDLDDYERTLLRIVHGPQAGDAIFTATRPPAEPQMQDPVLSGMGSSSNPIQLDEVIVPAGVDPLDWQFMSPEDRALFR